MTPEATRPVFLILVFPICKVDMMTIRALSLQGIMEIVPGMKGQFAVTIIVRKGEEHVRVG